ncbi:MAG: aminodeoxychorismate synthase component I [Candidatus Omnitrophica bacterium]|nr:aminodeoxychorismate synthase component I [Candidatus Omnitrophota bacterium]
MKDYLKETIELTRDPLLLLKAFEDQPYRFLLDSSLPDPHRGRYSFFGFDPFKVYQHKNRSHFDQLKKEYSMYCFDQSSDDILPSGIVGFIGYDHGLHQENIPLKSIDDFNLPDCLFGFYDCIITVDHVFKKMHITSTGYPEQEPAKRLKRAQDRIHFVKDRLNRFKKINVAGLTSDLVHTDTEMELDCNFTKDQYINAVEKALGYIAKGDIYQVNLSQRFNVLKEPNADPLLLYQYLRRYSPSRFGVYFDGGPFQVISSSPERYLQLRDNVLQTQPMKGTRPRGKTPQEDARYRQEILSSEKDKAELLMITDLERNDLGRVCEYGSVKVRDMRTIEEYSTVFQTTSTVEGQLRTDKDMFDVLSACFPGGSITGCPKIKSMNIIEELEPTRRSIYTGAFGYIGFNRQMDFNILIRTILSYQDRYFFQVGGGIVAESVPEDEYEETLVKAKAIQSSLKALNLTSNFQKV